jgi:hypothetical protein
MIGTSCKRRRVWLFCMGIFLLLFGAYWVVSLHKHVPFNDAFKTLYELQGAVYAPDPESKIGPILIVACGWFGCMCVAIATKLR